MLLSGFSILTAGIISIGYYYYRGVDQSYQREVTAKLSAVGELKVSELTQWRKERLQDGTLFFKNETFTALVKRFFEQQEDMDALRQLQSWLGQYLENPEYDLICLKDAQGVCRLKLPSDRRGRASSISQPSSEVLNSRKVIFQDFYQDPQDQRIHLAVQVPILDVTDAGRSLGLLVLRIDPDVKLYPFIRHWPTPSPSAETLLVRREENEVVFLNELRFESHTALKLRYSLNQLSLPAAQAVLGRQGIMNGIDYRGEPVMADLRTIPDSPWALVARVNTAEVSAPMKQQIRQIIFMTGALLFGVGVSLWAVWRQQRIRFYQTQAKMAEELQHLTLELQAKNAEMERFLYTASHDLKSPVVTIRTFLGYLKQDLASADAGRIEKDMNFMRVAADKMARLLDEMVDFARIGHTVDPPVHVDLKNLMDEVLGIVAGRITERGVTVKLGDLDVTLNGDRSRLAELWQNLLDNAVKFMGCQSEPCVEMGVERRTGEVVFYVRDNGIGIDPRYHAKVFGLFEKLDPKAEGTGIGLALVRRIVELYQGRIWLESAGLAQGTCFYFTLPGALINPTGEKT
ncbi:MAG: ATP-binding protein [bacterium]